jgi:subtilisin family serine protease
VCAAGNSGDLGNPANYPAAINGVMVVGAVDAEGKRAAFSNEGDYVYIAAPGVDIASTVPTYPVPNVVAYGSLPLSLMSGMSMAAAIVTALIARMLAFNPSLDRAQVRSLLRGNLRGEWNSEAGLGVIDAFATLSQL